MVTFVFLPFGRSLWQSALAYRVDAAVTPENLKTASDFTSKIQEVTELALSESIHFDFESLFKMLPDPCRLLTKLQSGDVADAEGLATINLMAETLPKFENWVTGLCDYEKDLANILDFLKQSETKGGIGDLSKMLLGFIYMVLLCLDISRDVALHRSLFLV